MKFKPFAAPNRFQFRDPDTGFLYEAPTRPKLLRHIVSYRIQNGLPQIVELSKVLDNYLCEDPMNKPNCEPTLPPKGFLYYAKGGVKLLKQMLFRNFAPQPEADRRSKICSTCKYNQFPDKGSYIGWANKIAEASVGNRKSAHHDQLGQCIICDCPLRPKVFYTGKLDLPADQTALMKEVNCWQPQLAEAEPSRIIRA